MEKRMRISFIGGGEMAEAMIKGILRGKEVPPESIMVSDIDAGRLHYLQREYAISTTQKNFTAVSEGKVVVLAVKPQDMSKVMEEIKGKVKEDKLFISIAAGMDLFSLCQGLEHNVVVRAIPNLPAQVGRGITVWTDTPGVTEGQREEAKYIFTLMGEEIFVSEERFIDMATAVSASGPAFILLVLESLTEAAVHIGLPWEVGRRLVTETVIGTAYLMQESKLHPAVLRNKITSPGGTTAEGLLRLEEGGLRALLIKAISASFNKAKIRPFSDRGEFEI
jgi:pyrroline-5-carboxylate reductase